MTSYDKTLKLANDLQIPVLGLGVWKIADEDVEAAVLAAIDAGYRHIDTAQAYRNEKGVGRAIKATDVDRSELYITTKLSGDIKEYETAVAAIDKSLSDLDLDYIDLMLIHSPQPWVNFREEGNYDQGNLEAWRALEEAHQAGKIKAIGVSNFYPDRLTDICMFDRKVIPAVNQVEVNPFNAQWCAQENMEKHGVKMEAWAPFGEGRNNLFTNETLVSIGKKYNKSSAQVMLRWLIQRGVIVACKSTHIERMQENINVFDFELTEEDMNSIKTLDTSNSLFFSHSDPNMVEWFDKIVKERRTNE